MVRNSASWRSWSRSREAPGNSAGPPRRAVQRATTVGAGGRAGVAEVLDAVRAAAAAGSTMLSICSGSFLLGAAGLLDGRPCTTHWMHADELRERYPRAEVDPDVLFVDDGNLITSAGTAAGIDACL